MASYVSRFGSDGYHLRVKPEEASKKLSAIELIKMMGKDMKKNG